MNGLGSLYEEDEAIYKLKEKKEEDKLFELNNSIRTLIESLEEKETLMEQKNESKAQ
jgi:hypothetical protein